MLHLSYVSFRPVNDRCGKYQILAVYTFTMHVVKDLQSSLASLWHGD